MKRKRQIAQTVEDIGNAGAQLLMAQEVFPEWRHETGRVLGWLETDLDYLEALTDGADGWKW